MAKLKQYTFSYTETNYGSLSVDAESEKEARKLAIEQASWGWFVSNDKESKLEIVEVSELED